MDPIDMMTTDYNCEYLGLSRLCLMENAGKSLSDEVATLSTFKFSRPVKILIFNGSGGNGGDGLVLIDNNKTFLEQFKDMPEANITNLGRIVQYVGETNQFYTNGYFYKSVSDGPTYHWEAVFNAINHTMYEITISPNSLYLSSLTGGQALFIPITQVGNDITGIAIISFSCQTSASIPSGSAIASMTISGYNLLAVGDFVSFANSSSSRYACPIQVTENSNSISAKDASISGTVWVSLVFMAKFQVA